MAMVPLLAAAVVLLACQGYGEAILRTLSIERRHDPLARIGRFAVAGACGHAVAGLVLLLLGALGLYSRWLLHLLPMPGLALAAWFGSRHLLAEREHLLGRSTPSLVALLLFGIIAGVLVSIALVPDIEIDDITYHQTVPRAYLNAGGIFFAPFEPLASWHQLSAMAHLWALALAPESVVPSKVLELARALLGALAATALVASLYGRGPAALTLLLSVLCLTVARYATTSHTDAGMALYLGAGALLSVRWLRDGAATREAALAGFLLGCCFGVKQTGLFIAAPLVGAALACGAVAWWRKDAAHAANFPRHAGLFIAGAALAAAPWMLRAFLLTGNPLYPFALGLFPLNSDAALAHTFVGIYYPPDRGLLETLGLGREHLYVVVSNVRLNSVTGLALLAPFAALCLVLRRPRGSFPAAEAILVTALMLLVVVLFKAPFWRFLAGAYPLAIGAALGEGTALLRARRWPGAGIAAAALLTWFSIAWYNFIHYDNFHHRAIESPGHMPAWTPAAERAYFRQHHPDAIAVRALNDLLGEDDLLLASFSSNALPLLSMRYLPNAPCIAQEGITTMAHNGWDADRMAAYLHALGVTHLATREPLDSGEPANLRARHLDVVHTWPEVRITLYRIRTTPR